MSKKADLPRSAQELIELLGHDDAYALIRELGGTAVYVAKTQAPGTKLYDRLGARIAGRLAAKFGGEYLMVPLSGTGSAAARRRAIIEDNRPAAATARTHGVHQISVHRIRGKAKRKTGGLQGDLFGGKG